MPDYAARMGPHSDNDEGITQAALAARNGDRAAAAEFVHATHRHLRRFIAYLAQPADVDDLVQDTYLRAMRALPTFAAQSSARAWLLAIARNVVADHFRSAWRRPYPVSLGDVDAGLAALSTPGFEDGVLLQRLLAGLRPDRREAFVATQIIGLSYEEAALVCDCPVGTIRSRVARARENLVTALAGTGRTDRHSAQA